MHLEVRFLWLWLLSTLLLAGCAWQPITEPRRFEPLDEPTPLPLREAADKPTYTVARGTVAQRFVLSGRAGSASELPIESNLDGTIASVIVRNGDTVIEGDLLALLDTSALESQLNELRNALASTQAQLELIQGQLSAELTSANLALERANLQLENARANGLSEAELRVLEIDVELAQLTVDQLNTIPNPALQIEQLTLAQQIADLEAQKATMRLFAPTDGDIVALNLELGRRVRVGGIIATLANFDQTVIWADASNSELAQLEEGMSVTLTLPDEPDSPFAGTIASLPFPQGMGGARERAVEVIAAELPPNLLFGDRINIQITANEQQNALWVPPVVLREFAGQTFVIVQESDGERRIDVEIGLTSTTRVEIVDGLEEGQIVVAP